ncbi:MAG TPA: xanthine dehydrogenase family protein molybdopterin-binding subunit [Bryobacteraceae bacterium]|nr:xanthine dehydrogenase family protein molybdopterin-binding subunit [Bryobacteraceae bacterium]
MSTNLSRRNFIQVGAAATGGLLVSVYAPDKLRAATTPAKLNAFIHIGSDDMVTFMIHKSEMGQGPVTALSQLLAEELECDWTKIRTEFPGVDPAYGPLQGTFGSMTIRTSYNSMRQAGATARMMLIQAAAQKWGVDASQCRAENNAVINTVTNARASFGSLADDAAKIPAPKNVTLKEAKDFRLIGTSVKRRDTTDKVTGRTPFGLDMRLPGMLYAALARCPVYGGKVKSFDASKAKAVPGVKNAVEISNGVAVIADNTWSAMEGRKALQIVWDEGHNANLTSAGIRKEFADLTEKPGANARKQGDAPAAMASAAKKVEALYEAPYLSHAPMEPLNCTAVVRPDGCEVWASTQIQTAAHQIAMKITGLSADKVQIHTQWLGGGFGRRGGADYIGEGVEIAKALTGTPVKLTWSRDDDLQHDTYRPGSVTKFAAALDAQGNPVALTSTVACPSFAGLQNGVDRAAVEGIANMAYFGGIPNAQVDYHVPPTDIPTSYWRSVGYSQNTFFTESFIDELAHAAGKDPVAFRRALVAKSPRLVAVLDLAADKAGWSKPLPAGRYRGVALVDNLGSFNAQVAEISIDKGKLRVHKVVTAVDCGQVVNPAIVVQQIRSGIVYGLSAMKGAITFDKGRVQQQNFNNYEVLRIDEAPEMEVYIVPSTAAPGGIGEASTPAIGPAVANAIFAATGKRLRKLPIRNEDLA